MRKRIIFLLTLFVVLNVSISSANTELYLYEDWSNSPQGDVLGKFDGLTFEWDSDDIVIDNNYVTIDAIGNPDIPQYQAGGGFWTYDNIPGMMQSVLINESTTISFEINGDTNEPNGDFALVALFLGIDNAIDIAYVIAGDYDVAFKNIFIGPGIHKRNLFDDLVCLGMDPNITDRIYVASIIGTTVATNTSTAWGEFGFLEIDSASSPTAEFTVSPEVPFTGQEVTFDASSSRPQADITTYDWDFGDGGTETSSNPITTHTYKDPNIYAVVLTVTDSNGVTDSNSIDIEVLSKPPAPFDPNEFNALQIENFVQQFMVDAEEPHVNQGFVTYVEQTGNLNGIDANDIFYEAPEEDSSKIVSLISQKNMLDEIIGFDELSKDVRPVAIDPNDPNSYALLELTIFSPEAEGMKINSENELKFWIADVNSFRDMFGNKVVTIQQVSMDPNIEYPVLDVRKIIDLMDSKMPLDYLVTDINTAPADPNITVKVVEPNVPYTYLTLSTNRDIADIDGNGKVDLVDYDLLLAVYGEQGILRSDIASRIDDEIVLGIPDGVVDYPDEIAFILDYNQKNPGHPITHTHIILEE